MPHTISNFWYPFVPRDPLGLESYQRRNSLMDHWCFRNYSVNAICQGLKNDNKLKAEVNVPNGAL